MGTIVMVGIVVSFSVLLVDFANRLLEQARSAGIRKSPYQAVVDAAGIRLRPILMTGLSAILGCQWLLLAAPTFHWRAP
jgi:multidrug efflux pump subunit AcrB